MHPRRRFDTLPLSVAGFRLAAGLGFATRGQARQTRPAESSSSSYGLVVHLLLLPTPPRGGAVTVGYRPESAYLKRTFTAPTMYTLGRTDALRAPQGRGGCAILECELI